MKKILATLSGVAAAAVMVVAPLASAATLTTVYDNIPDPQPSNVPSIGYEATSTLEFGGGLQLAGTQRTNPKVTVLMSSWACENGSWNTGTCSTTPGVTFTHPVTLNVYNYNSDGSVGSLITSQTQTFTMPFRPSADSQCGNGWFDGTSCFSGKAFPISFDFSNLVLPDQVIVSVAYNTSHYGAQPIGTASCSSQPQGCPYDSLNVGTSPMPTTGTALPTNSDAYLSSTWGGAYCDGGTSGTGAFRVDTGCWDGYLPAIQVEASAPLVSPTNKDQCKKDGWKAFNNPEFKNQGQCVSFLERNANAVR